MSPIEISNLYVPNVVSIAGIDPSGGAGVLADVKTFSALGAYGCGVVAALTAQNTRTVTGIHEVPADFLALQLETLFCDVRIDAVKIGMLATRELIGVVAEALRRHAPRFVVLDPVMVAKSGDRLLRPDAVQALIHELLPLATVVTPNLPEAGHLLGAPIGEMPEDMLAAARDLHALGARAVLLKGGHGTGERLTDLLYVNGRSMLIAADRIHTTNTHTRNLFAKLEVHSRAAAVARALRDRMV